MYVVVLISDTEFGLIKASFSHTSTVFNIHLSYYYDRFSDYNCTEERLFVSTL